MLATVLSIWQKLALFNLIDTCDISSVKGKWATEETDTPKGKKPAWNLLNDKWKNQDLNPNNFTPESRPLTTRKCFPCLVSLPLSASTVSSIKKRGNHSYFLGLL
jgi:hypothetical protein